MMPPSARIPRPNSLRTTACMRARSRADGRWDVVIGGSRTGKEGKAVLEYLGVGGIRRQPCGLLGPAGVGPMGPGGKTHGKVRASACVAPTACCAAGGTLLAVRGELHGRADGLAPRAASCARAGWCARPGDPGGDGFSLHAAYARRDAGRSPGPRGVRRGVDRGGPVLR